MRHLKDVCDTEACFEAPPWGPGGLCIGTNLQAQHPLCHYTLNTTEGSDTANEVNVHVGYLPHAAHIFTIR